jgi:short-subunit dehydrogenase
MQNPKNILISGASSGIGRELAIAYSAADVNLFLCGRNSEKLDEVKIQCERLKANVSCKILDVQNSAEVKNWIEEIEEKFPLDLVIANAGISAGTAGGSESFEQVKKIFSTNLDGVLNLIHPAIEKMLLRKKGQIAIMSSLAGFRGLPSSPAYSASKSAVRVYAESLRGNLGKFGIEVNAICPGYIKTPMTDVNEFPMPFLMSVEEAAQIIKNGLTKNKSRIAFPFSFYFIVWLMTLLSTKITDPIFAKLPAKKSLSSQARHP